MPPRSSSSCCHSSQWTGVSGILAVPYLPAIAAQLPLRCCWHGFSVTVCTFVDSIIKMVMILPQFLSGDSNLVLAPQFYPRVLLWGSLLRGYAPGTSQEASLSGHGHGDLLILVPNADGNFASSTDPLLVHSYGGSLLFLPAPATVP
jgi:hypothetical protein